MSKFEMKEIDYHKQLIDAINDRNPAKVTEVLRGIGEDINKTDENGYTPLMYAVNEGQAEVIGLLLADQRLDVNAQSDKGDISGTTAAYFAVRKNDTETLQKLINNKADLSLALTGKMRGYNILMYAAELPHPEMIEFILTQDIHPDINARAVNNTSAIDVAIKTNQPANILKLIQHDAKVGLEEIELLAYATKKHKFRDETAKNALLAQFVKSYQENLNLKTGRAIDDHISVFKQLIKYRPTEKDDTHDLILKYLKNKLLQQVEKESSITSGQERDLRKVFATHRDTAPRLLRPSKTSSLKEFEKLLASGKVAIDDGSLGHDDMKL